MRIAIATPLYPPEIAAPAPYIKELAKRLAGRHEVTIVAYGRLPEQVPGVHIMTVDKRQPLLSRLIAYTRALRQVARRADIIYAVNGASVELPVVLATLSSPRSFVLGIADPVAREHAKQSWALHAIDRIAAQHSRAVIEHMPLPRPEINPLTGVPKEAFDAYEDSWQAHLEELETQFATYAR